MEKIQFKCELLSDVVLNDSPATEGKRRCLDFIPGSNFLGITAAQLYLIENDETWLLFHSGHVRFGDAHPSCDGKRGLKVPASFFYPKGRKIEEACYVHHLLEDDEVTRALQLKQCRSDFYTFNSEHIATKVFIGKDFTIKSAYDSDQRRAKDNQMFGYEALCKGLVMYFSVELDDDAIRYKDGIIKALCGQHHVGRSRSAQYGWVEISLCPYEEVATLSQPISIQGKSYVAVYADSRLIFFDENGNSTFQPTAKDLGFTDDATIDWSLSQVRTFQYAPWNYKRQAFDADRCGIEKGSVFLVKSKEKMPATSTIGFYQNEGFGHIVYNPVFLQANSDGSSSFCFTEQKVESEVKTPKKIDSQLIDFLQMKKAHAKNQNDIIKAVNEFVEEYKELFQRGSFASQWGSIRNLAMVYEDDETLRKMIEGFVTHGVKSDDWLQRGRYEKLKEFLNCNEPKGHLQEAVINLASEMAKICKS